MCQLDWHHCMVKGGNLYEAGASIEGRLMLCAMTRSEMAGYDNCIRHFP